MTAKEWRESTGKENVDSNAEAGVGKMYSDYRMMRPPNGMGGGG